MGEVKTLSFANGDQMPILGLGTWKSAPGEVYVAVREAIRIGYRHIDCAAAYGNETEIGNALRDALRDGDVTRKELWITSKLWCADHGRSNVRPALEKTLQDLGLSYLDLYEIHWPIPLKRGVGIPSSAAEFLPPAEVPLYATWEGMEGAVSAGLARHLGVSNFSAKKLRDLMERCKIPPEVNQVELHPLLQQKELVAYCAAQGIHVTAYSPLGSPDRPAFVRAPGAPVLLDDPVIRSIAEARGCTPAQVLLAWHILRGISVIAKSVNSSRLRDNFAAAALELSPSDLERIASLDRNLRLIATGFWVLEGSPWTLHTIWDGP
jgi:alcohol dehydrogenase (NADP+)